jgi:hypothetical protein
MTNEELLQQAKEQVAKKYGYKVGDGKDWHRCTFGVFSDLLKEYQDEAALVAIQSAREEGHKAGYKEGKKDGLTGYIQAKYDDTNFQPGGVGGDS